MPKAFVEGELAAALGSLTTWKDGQRISTAPQGRRLVISWGEWAVRTSKAAARKVGEYFPRAWCEEHVVIGLQLQGMSKVGYIYAHDKRETDIVSAYGDMKMMPPIPFKSLLASQNQQSPDPRQLGQLSGVEAEKVVETGDAANTNFAVETENAKMSQTISFPNLFASPNQTYPDPGQWGQMSGIETEKAVKTG